MAVNMGVWRGKTREKPVNLRNQTHYRRAWYTKRKIIYLRTRINYLHCTSKCRFISVSIAVGLPDKISRWRFLALQTKPLIRVWWNWHSCSYFCLFYHIWEFPRKKNFGRRRPPRRVDTGHPGRRGRLTTAKKMSRKLSDMIKLIKK